MKKQSSVTFPKEDPVAILKFITSLGLGIIHDTESTILHTLEDLPLSLKPIKCIKSILEDRSYFFEIFENLSEAVMFTKGIQAVPTELVRMISDPVPTTKDTWVLFWYTEESLPGAFMLRDYTTPITKVLEYNLELDVLKPHEDQPFFVEEIKENKKDNEKDNEDDEDDDTEESGLAN